jgi:WD40 repeat protein
MVNELQTENEDLINLVYGLYKLFLEIDFNGDEKMQWEEFTQFIIDSVMGENEKAGDDEDDVMGGGGKDTSEKAMIKYKRYNTSVLTEDKTLHDTDIIDCAYHPKIDKIFVVEYKSKKIKMYNPRSGRIDYSFDLDDYFKVKKESNIDNDLDDDDKKGNEKKKKLKKESKQLQLTFSVLSFSFSVGNILAICTTNKKILFFEFNADGKEEFRYEITTPLLQKRVWYLNDHNVWLSTGMKKEEDKHFQLNELDIEFEYKNSKLEILTNIGTKIDDRNVHMNPYRGSIGEHGKEILDCIEIKKPMLVLTACMDKKIRLINLNDREIVEIWDDQHKSAIRSLDYNPNVGVGTILSVGFEYSINVWSPEVALNDAFKGKLEGHYSPVIMCKFLSGSPMCVSVDEEGNVRIWDSRQLLCLQLIPQEKKNFKVTRLLNLHKHNRFLLYGNKIVFYDPKYRDSDIKPKNQKVDDNYPIKVAFNKYYMKIYVCTTKDVRIYSSDTGELIKVFKNLRSNVNDQEAKIRFFGFEDRHRKFYLGFSHGAIQLFNAGNGSLIKRIGEYEEEKEGITVQRYDHNSEISSIFYEEKFQLLITTGYDSLINCYDESNSEEAIKLRNIKGSHKIAERNNQILSFDFSRHLNLFATGSSDGLVIVWDFELSKVDEVLYLTNVDKDKVHDCLNLKFMAPYPILATSFSDGSIYLWGVRPLFHRRGECFMAFRNCYVINNKMENVAVTCSLFVEGKIEEITVNKRDYFEPSFENQVKESNNEQKIEEKVDKKNNKDRDVNPRFTTVHIGKIKILH